MKPSHTSVPLTSPATVRPTRSRPHRGATLVSGLCLLACLIALSACRRLAGWGVVLWPSAESGLTVGAVIPVHFKSNISRTWIIDIPGSSDKQEVELWRLSVHASKGKAEQYAEDFQTFARLYGLSRRDGLVLRDAPENLGKQVYRLRLDETIKLLKQVAGAAVETGGQALEGDWYLALAEDGTTGYVFSNQLAIWADGLDAQPPLTANAPAMDVRMMDIFDATWRPDYFAAMQASGRIDLNRYQLRFGIFADPINRQIRIELPWFSNAYKYTAIDQQADGSFVLRPSGAIFHFTQSGDLVFTPPEADISDSVRQSFQNSTAPLPSTITIIAAPAVPAAAVIAASQPPATTPATAPAVAQPSAAAPTEAATATAAAVEEEPVAVSFLFKRQTGEPRQVIAAEERRRLNLLATMVAGGEYFESMTGGVLVITPTGRFTWMGYETLVPAVIPANRGDRGQISMDLYLHPQLQTEWQGAFTLRFDNFLREPLQFAYKIDQQSLTIVPLPAGSVRISTVLQIDPALGIFFMRY